MGETEKNLQAAIAKLSNLSKKGIGIARESIVQSSHVVKSKIDITSLQREKKRFSLELGEAVYASIKEGTLKSDLFDELVAHIDEVEKKIEEKEEDIVVSKEAMSSALSEIIDFTSSICCLTLNTSLSISNSSNRFNFSFNFRMSA